MSRPACGSYCFAPDAGTTSSSTLRTIVVDDQREKEPVEPAADGGPVLIQQDAEVEGGRLAHGGPVPSSAEV